MRCMQIVAKGEPLVLNDVPVPLPAAGEIRVRVEAAGMCHSDAHYRDGTADVARLPITPGHEVAGVVDAVGQGVADLQPGDRVALHYLVTCGACDYCRSGREQFCPHVQMLGKDRDGGYAEYVVVPARNAIAVADCVSMAEAAIMMCSSSTAFHALSKARLRPGDRVAVFGVGGLGMSAIQLARACGAGDVFAVDIDQAKLAMAAGHGAQPVNGADGTAVEQIQAATHGRGVDVAVELAGRNTTQEQAVAVLAVQGRAALVGIAATPFKVNGYREVIGREAEIIGVSDHLRSDLITLMDFARRGLLDLSGIVAERIPLVADPVNRHLDALSAFHGVTRTVVEPQRHR